jgi:hypothetical protein
MVDLAIIRDMESQAVEAFLERERTPTDILMPLSAVSQMWVFSLYEFLRTWRQRAYEVLRISEKYNSLGSDKEKKIYLDNELEKAQKKEGLIQLGLKFYSKHIGAVTDPEFVQRLVEYRNTTDLLFKRAEALRVTLAKHEVPKTPGFIAEAPGYGRMNQMTGSMYWFIVLKDGSQLQVDRRALADVFLGIDGEEL